MPGGMVGGGGADGTGGAAGSGGAGGMGGAGAEGQGANGNCGENTLPGGVGGMEQDSAGCNGAGGGVGQYPGESEAERQARLEGELEKSVGGFDEVLAEEQREISTQGRNTDGFGGGAGGGGGGVGLGKQGAGMRGDGSAANTTSEDESRASPSMDGLSEEQIKERTPDDIPDLVSEDIVAKQLREAALSEDDPKLRERLWEEYRIYNDL